MNEIKSYEVPLRRIDRINLFISGALSWDQIFSDEPFYIKQNEIQFIIDPIRLVKKVRYFFERDQKIHVLFLDKNKYLNLYEDNKSLICSENSAIKKSSKYGKASGIFFLVAFAIAISLTFIFNPSTLTYFFASQTCRASCSQLIATTSFVLGTFALFLVGVPLIYLVLHHLLVNRFRYQPGRPYILPLIFSILIFSQYSSLVELFDDSGAKVIFSHWKKGTLNKQTVAQIKLEFNKQHESQREPTSQKK